MPRRVDKDPIQQLESRLDRIEHNLTVLRAVVRKLLGVVGDKRMQDMLRDEWKENYDAD